MSMSGLPRLDRFARDFRQGMRALRKSPGFAVAAILSLALGVGATTAVFSIADAVLFRSLPYRHPEQLVTIAEDGAISAPLFEAFRRDARTIEKAALFTSWNSDLSGQGVPERIPGARVSAELFDVLGVAPKLGRAFTPAEDRVGAAHVVLLGDALWKRRFGGDRRIIGHTIVLNGLPYSVVGVMPPGFRFPEGPEHHNSVGPFPPAEMWRPMALENWERTCKGCFNFAMLARLRAGVTARAAAAELTAILNRENPARKPGEPHEATVLGLQDAVTARVRAPIVLLFGSVLLALLIACVNVANLLLARALRRREEVAVRSALGATRGRLAQQAIAEALALAFCAAVIAVPIAWAAIRGLVALAPTGIPRLDGAGLDASMLAVALGLALASVVLFGVAPALWLAGQAPSEAIKTGGRGMSAAPSRLRAGLVVAEVALSLVLLVGSGLLGKSFLNVSGVPLGFHAENVLTLRSSLPQSRYDDQRRAALIRQLVADSRGLPGVTAVAATSTLPLTGEAEGWGLVTEDNPDPNAYVMLRVRAVTPGYFQTLGMRLRAGRDFDDHDRGTNPVAIISETAARRLWPGVANPLGRRLRDKPPMTVVGIVEDTHASGIDADVLPYLYLPFSQFAPAEFALAVRSAADPAALARAITAQVWRIDKDQPVTHVATMKQLVADSIESRHFLAVLMTALAAFALVLAAVGVYGILAYAVASRTREIGIRLALGATRRRVLTGIVEQACALTAVGAFIGLLVAARLAPLLRSLLFGVGPVELSVFAGGAVLLLVVAVLASVIPAQRAARLDPMTCLRYE